MRLGGLFSGVGGFELAWTQLGHEVAWMCEWDKNARKVLEERFPGVPIYPDVRDLDPAEVEAVDVLTGGSPCQGFSIAGTRSGLEHSESQLFADYVRIMDGLAARGLQYAVWENVPGVLSIKNEDGERTFTHVIGALVGAAEPVRLDPKRKWNVGLAANGERGVAWRVLDSRYFGVAQRRRRVFACVAFGDSAADRAGRALLAVAEGVRGDSASGVEARQGVAGGVAGGVGGPSGVAHTLTVASSKGATEDGTGRGTPIVSDVAHTLTGNGFDASEDGRAAAPDSSRRCRNR
jgi:DNA (cytosine-5)-methyltransferase 1